ncbi:MAG: DeoR/GlpR transcriptional regulator, partial [Spirochaetaceae bacterium]|nr:DeoR/GlpR transcriptional regulator [Spirochaetaceae bacterium]
MLLLNEREQTILDLLIDDPHIGVAEMGKRLEVSSVTVRSDFDTLAEKGYLIRTRGGALPAFHPAILARQRNLPERKSAIAKTAASLIGDGDTI